VIIDIRGQAVSEPQKELIQNKIIEKTNDILKKADIEFN